jgi:putative transposase
VAALFRHAAVHCRALHGQLANRVPKIGRIVKMKEIPYRPNERQCGKSVNVRAPGMFVLAPRRKAEGAGWKVIEFPKGQAKLSQLCHGCGTVEKRPLPQRIPACKCGCRNAARPSLGGSCTMCWER